ncbi:ribonuclease VapC11 [bacterium BMS3Abin14]|nr:ribonuclease VapC11 [bacterium BMS3Abin14]
MSTLRPPGNSDNSISIPANPKNPGTCVGSNSTRTSISLPSLKSSPRTDPKRDNFTILFLRQKSVILITDIILTEILQGIKNDVKFKSAKDYLLEFPIYGPKNTGTYTRAAQLYRDCRKKGKTVRKTIDCIIAAICIENDLALLHKGADFNSIEACTALRVIRNRC